MRGGRDERVSAPSLAPAPLWRTVGLAVGAILAVAATVVVFLTEDPQLLRVAVVAGAWAFVLALLATGRRRDAAADPADPGRAHRPELEREAAGHRQHELETESRLRRESDEAVRAELAALRRDVAAVAALRHDLAALGALRQEVAALGALRADVAALTGLRSDVAALGALRAELTALSGLRQDVAALGALREDVAGPGGLRDEVARLAAMRAELGQLADLRTDLGRLRTELTEQLSSEMFLERVVMRTQSSRGPVPTVEGPGTRSFEAVGWSAEEPPRELTGGWPAVRLDSPVPAVEGPVTRTYDALAGSWAQQAAPPAPAPAPEPPVVAAEADPARRRRRTDDPDTAEQLTVERPLAAASGTAAAAPAASDLEAWPRPPAPLPPEPLTVQAPAVPTPGEARLAQILAENAAGAAPSSGRRRHRYRDDDEDDDVLARVLRKH
ncbi:MULTISPECIES: DUF6779 domain-containing protein [unclassified Blastococcus]